MRTGFDHKITVKTLGDLVKNLDVTVISESKRILEIKQSNSEKVIRIDKKYFEPIS